TVFYKIGKPTRILISYKNRCHEFGYPFHIFKPWLGISRKERGGTKSAKKNWDAARCRKS
ncbi:MAG TPA: hypothetical protein PLR74_17300, partial [Agriterribacter sp.]|nr:hypothetical protein [Agriterribacter sp.]